MSDDPREGGLLVRFDHDPDQDVDVEVAPDPVDLVVQIEDDLGGAFDVERESLEHGVHVLESGGATEIVDPRVPRDNPGSLFESEFDGVLEKESAAQVDSTGHPVDDLDQQIQIREAEHRESNSQSPHVCVNPVSWDQSLLGSTVTLRRATVSTNSGPIARLAFWQGESRDACPVTVTVGVPNGLVVPGASVLPIARIEWGVHGGKFVAEVDMFSGAEFTVVASSIYVSGFLENASLDSLDVTASIGFRTTQRTAPVLRTKSITSGSTTTITVTRPPFASAIYGFDRETVANQYTLTLLDGDGNVTARRVIAANAYLTTPIPIPGNCTQVQITNNTGSDLGGSITFWVF